uniref:Uncharacterized protein n=1 Tax=Rhizophora mucronata TaxID=61149 RepID=A0A2P2J9A7_RHIMU
MQVVSSLIQYKNSSKVYIYIYIGVFSGQYLPL